MSPGWSRWKFRLKPAEWTLVGRGLWVILRDLPALDSGEPHRSRATLENHDPGLGGTQTCLHPSASRAMGAGLGFQACGEVSGLRQVQGRALEPSSLGGSLTCPDLGLPLPAFPNMSSAAGKKTTTGPRWHLAVCVPTPGLTHPLTARSTSPRNVVLTAPLGLFPPAPGRLTLGPLHPPGGRRGLRRRGPLASP